MQSCRGLMWRGTASALCPSVCGHAVYAYERFRPSIHNFFTTCFGTFWSCHVSPCLIEFSGVLLSCFTLSRSIVFTEPSAIKPEHLAIQGDSLFNTMVQKKYNKKTKKKKKKKRKKRKKVHNSLLAPDFCTAMHAFFPFFSAFNTLLWAQKIYFFFFKRLILATKQKLTILS